MAARTSARMPAKLCHNREHKGRRFFSGRGGSPRKRINSRALCLGLLRSSPEPPKAIVVNQACITSVKRMHASRGTFVVGNTESLCDDSRFRDADVVVGLGTLPPRFVIIALASSLVNLLLQIDRIARILSEG